MFIGLLTSLVNASNQRECVSLSGQSCKIQPTLNLHPDEESQELQYNPFAIKLDRCFGSCNTFNGLSNKVCVPNKTEHLSLVVLNMIAGMNKSKTLKKTYIMQIKCKFDGRKCNSN